MLIRLRLLLISVAGGLLLLLLLCLGAQNLQDRHALKLGGSAPYRFLLDFWLELLS